MAVLTVIKEAATSKEGLIVIGTVAALGVAGYVTRDKVAKPLAKKIKAKMPHKKADVITNTDKTGMADKK